MIQKSRGTKNADGESSLQPHHDARTERADVSNLDCSVILCTRVLVYSKRNYHCIKTL